MRAGWRFSSVSLAFLLTYAVTSLIFLRPPLHPARPTTAAAAANDNRTKDNDGRDHDRGRRPRIQSAPGADSIVFIALGPAARSTSLLYALSSLREEGQWDGAVHVIVEHEDDLDCLSSYLRQSVTAIAIAPPSPSGHGREQETGGGGADERASPVTEGGVFKSDRPGRGTGTAVGDGGGGGKPGGFLVNNAKMAKMKLLDLLPPSVERVVYVDCDVITQKPLGPFLDAIAQEWNELDKTAAAAGRWPFRQEGGEVAERSMGSNSRPLSSPPPPPPSTLLIFEDAGGHTVPVCRGCDRAHSGVVALARGHSERCLEQWHDAFQGNGGGGRDGGGTATDQEALDVALREGSGCRARWIGRRHLSFMKDAFVMAGLTRRSTFGHFTGLLHPQGLGAVYRRFYEWALGRGFGEWGQGEIESCAVGV